MTSELKRALLREIALQHVREHDLTRKLSSYDDEPCSEEEALAPVLTLLSEGELVLIDAGDRDPPFIIRNRGATS